MTRDIRSKINSIDKGLIHTTKWILHKFIKKQYDLKSKKFCELAVVMAPELAKNYEYMYCFSQLISCVVM